MEYIELGALSQHIREGISEEAAKQIARQLLQALKYMHDADYTHRDIKPMVSI
jgi:serine/threonine protein kinase